MKTRNPRKSSTCTPRHEGSVVAGREQNVSATIICNGRPALTHKAKYLIKLMKGLVPDDALDYVEYELCSETRPNQNLMADKIFAILVEAWNSSIIEDTRLSIKVEELTRMLLSYIDPHRMNRYK